MLTKINNYQAAIRYLEYELPRSDAEVFTGEIGLKRSKQFFSLLGNPQNQLKVIHFAGTSGKGSTAMMLSAILAAHGKRVGLTLSPYVYDIRERCQINNRLIGKSEFTAALNQVLPAIKNLQQNNIRPSYFEVLIAMALVTFIKKKVDYAILETGLGGELDATNTISRPDKICLITSIGLDHVAILGNSIAKIARQKAGIILSNNKVFSALQSKAAEAVLKKVADSKGADLEFIGPKLDSGDSLNPQLQAKHQQQNLALAKAAARYLSARDNWLLNLDKVAVALNRLSLPGRFELLKIGKKLFVLDGAHNQQKLNALFAAVKQQFKTEPFGLVFAMKKSKQIPKLPKAAMAVVSSFPANNQDMPIPAFSARVLATALRKKNPQLPIQAEPNLKVAIQQALKSDINLWIVTGSFFILAEVKQFLKRS